MIRDLKMSFRGIGVVNSVVVVAMLLSGPFWGQMVDRYGCRAVLTACSATLPGHLVELWQKYVPSAFPFGRGVD